MSPNTYFAILTFVFSLCIGSFLNVVIYRLPIHMSLSKPNSHCPNCDYELKWYDNIPLLSYLILGGKCRNCKKPISPRYFVVELFTALAGLFIFLWFKMSIQTIYALILLYCFIPIFFIDLKTYEIPDSLVLIIAIVGVISLFTGDLDYVADGYYLVTWYDKLIGFGVAVLIYLIFLLLEKTTQKEYIGGGDLKLFGAVSLLLGYRLLILGIVFASFIALPIELIFKKKLKRELDPNGKQMIPFGPYLCLGFMVSLLFGLYFLDFYVTLFL